ncbi:MAG: ArsA family ATPase [Halobacteriales archaeon]
MGELDVEAVEAVERDATEYVLYGGKGGVGKTTMAAATGLASAAADTATLIVSTDPAHSLSDTFERDIPPEPTRIHDEYPLYGAEIDPDAAMAETPLFGEDGEAGGGMLGGLGGLGELLGETAPEQEGDPLGMGLGGAVPGADEAAAFQQLLRYLDDDRFERVVIDTAPTGHTLRLLELPDVMETMVGRLLRLRERFQGMMGGITDLFGDDDDTEMPDAEEIPQDLEALSERIERLRATLQDPSRTDFRIVMVPEEMSILESQRLRSQLEGFDIPVGTVVVNRVMEDLADITGEETDADFVAPNIETCEFCKRRWEVQQTALNRAQELFRHRTVRRVPLFADEVRGESMLRVVARCLAE